MQQGCMCIHSLGCGQRWALILGEDQAMTHWSCLILTDFQFKRLSASQKPENIENVQSAQAPFVEQFPLSRYYSSVQPLYESLVYLRSGRSVVFQRPRWSFPSVSGLQTCISSSSETSVFATKFHHFFGVMEPVACSLITFLFRNAKRSYQDRTKP